MDVNDVRVLRELAKEVREAASTPSMEEKRRLWKAHNDLKAAQPLVLFEAVSVTHELFPESSLKCQSDIARSAEKALRLKLFHASVIKDDLVVDAEYRVNFHVKQHGWREKLVYRTARGDDAGLHSYVPIPLLSDPEDIYGISHSTFSVDREKTLSELAFWEDIFGDILNVRLRGAYWWTLGMTWDFIRLTGMETFLTLPYDDEDAFHAIMRFLTDDQYRFFDFLERENLLTLNNGNDYVGSGGYGYTGELPSSDFAGTVRTKDLWCLLESQESVGMSPTMFKDFIFPYQMETSKRFGRVYYGCCEPLHERYEIIREMDNLRTLSVSPWCDMKRLSQKISKDIIVACKPNPAFISQGFEEDALRAHVAQAKDSFKNNEIEYVMKDVHTIGGDISRITRWIDMARERLG